MEFGKMMMAVAVASLLSGCATTSFAPPSVNLEYETSVRGSDLSNESRCLSNERLVDGKYVKIDDNVAGATALVNNFIYMYRCRAHSAANGRQIFEVPALLVGLGTASAMAFGAPADVAIAGGAGAAGLNAGKNYYGPKQKAAIFDSSLDALLCIKTEALGIDPFTLEAISLIEKEGGNKLNLVDSNQALVTTDKRYFELVSASLLSVESVLAQRLSNVGSFDPAGVIAEIKTLADEVREKTAEGQKFAAAQAKGIVNDGRSKDATPKANAAANSTALEKKVEQVVVQLEALQPKLQQCVVRAKI